MKQTLLATLIIALAVVSGCDDMLNMDDTTPTMKDRGMVYILPGIQGVDSHYFNIRQGLRGAGLNCAIKIHPWGSQIPGIGMAINQTNTMADEEWGETIAREIAEYQEAYPGRRVYVIGHSGGGGVAVFVAESLATIPGAKPIDGVVMLEASLSSDYDVSTALTMLDDGIVNFHNPQDTALLGEGTAMFGNVDGGHGDSAGLKGLYTKSPKVFNVTVTPDMIDAFNDPHFADTTAAFATRYIAPWILEKSWPPHGVTTR